MGEGWNAEWRYGATPSECRAPAGRSVERLALTVDQVREWRLPAAVGKAADPRWPAFAQRHGLRPDRPVPWEVEALESAELHRLVLGLVDEHTDRDALAAVLAEERRQRRELDGFRRAWRDCSR